MSSEKQQEVLMKLSIFEQQINQMQQQLQAIEQGIVDLDSLNIGLDDLKNPKGKEIMAPVGRGIFIKAKVESENLLVDIGEGNLVTKSIEDAKKILTKQSKKLAEVKIELQQGIDTMSKEMEKLVGEFQSFEK